MFTEEKELEIVSKIIEQPIVETVNIVLEHNGGPLQAGQKAYLTNVKKRTRTVVSIAYEFGLSITDYSGTGYFTLPPNRLPAFALTLVNLKGERLLQQYPMGALSKYSPLGTANGYAGKMSLFYLPDVDLQNSYVTFLTASNPLATNYVMPLTFTYLQ